MKSINHYSQLFGFFGPNAFLDCTRMWTMRYAAGMQGDHATRYIFAAHEIPVHIIDHFIAIYITVIIRSRNGLRVVVEQPGTKRANNIIVRFKCLVNRRWLMHTSCYRLKIMDAES